MPKKASFTLSYYISKYGEDVGSSKYKERIDRISKNNRDNFIGLYGEDKWKDRIEKIKYKTSMEYFINSFGYEEGMRKFESLRRSYSFTKDDYIEKYGLDKWIDRASRNFRGFYSKEAKRFFELLLDKISVKYNDIRNIKWLENEFFIWDNEYRRIYFYDFYFEVRDKKIIIEYDNLFWHPKKDPNGNFNKNYFTSFDSILTENEKFEYDERKRNIAKYKGYEIISIESSETNPIRDEYKYEGLLKSALDFIDKKIKNE